MTDHEIALRYAPLVYFDDNETVPLRAVGYTVARSTRPSDSFYKRPLVVPEGAAFTIEYAYYWDYDINHMYDLEHIWVTVDLQGHVMDAYGSFHGNYLNLYVPELPTFTPPVDDHLVAFCQPGKHAFMMDGQLFRLIPLWRECCSTFDTARVSVGNPFNADHSGTGKPLYTPTEEDHANCRRCLAEDYAFTPSMHFTKTAPDTVPYIPWKELFAQIPGWINTECARLRERYGKAEK